MSKCPHGLDPAACLICKTLGTGPVTAQAQPGRRFARHRDEAVRPVAVYPPAGPARQGGSFGLHVGMVIAAVLVIGVIAWIVAGIVFALLHVIELLLVAAAAGWAGYRLGHHRGLKDRSGS